MKFKIMIALNCFGPYPYGYYPTAYDLLMFALGSLVIISFLVFYYHKIPKSNNSKTVLDHPIYQTKDILLKSNSANASFVFVEKTASSWIKVLAFVLIILMAFTPFQDFL